MVILGITAPRADVHDNSAVLLVDGQLVFAASEERFTRKKHDMAFPRHAIAAALAHAHLRLKDIDVLAAVTPDYTISSMILREPRKYLHLCAQLLARAPIATIRPLLHLLSPEVSRVFHLRGGSQIPPREMMIKNINTMFFDHHLTHAASAYYLQSHRDCLVLAFDGYGPTCDGQWLSGVVYDGKGGALIERDRVTVAASFGLFYQAVTVALGFAPNDGEGKTMGLAAYGKRTPALAALQKLAPHWDGSTWHGMNHWREFMLSGRKIARPLFCATPSGSTIKTLIDQDGPENVAWAAQQILEDELTRYIRTFVERSTHIAAAGGIFLNVKLNKKLRELPRVKSVFVQPHAGDGGCALGAAFLASPEVSRVFHLRGGSQIPPREKPQLHFKSAALGVKYSDEEILKTLRQYQDKITYKKSQDPAAYVGKQLTHNKVIGWFQGRAEWGPRALGQRSVLADPRDPKVKDRINTLLKQREWFMPFAPSVLQEEASKWFRGCTRSPFMTMVYDVPKTRAKKIKAAIHIDNTARPNTVSKKDNPPYYNIIKTFQKHTGIPLILNTSFNKHGLPIVNSPKDAIDHLLWGCVDELVIGPFIVRAARKAHEYLSRPRQDK